MTKIILLLIIGCAFVFSARAQDHPSAAPVTGDALVHWMTIEQAFERSKIEKRPIFIDVYTDWCGYCKLMDRNTFNERIIATLLNSKYYPVKFDAEQRGDIVLNGSTMKFIPNGDKGIHQFALALLRDQVVFPTVVFMNPDLQSVFPMAGYRAPAEFHKFLAYFSEDRSKNGATAWVDFEKGYSSPYGPPAPAGGSH